MFDHLSVKKNEIKKKLGVPLLYQSYLQENVFKKREVKYILVDKLSHEHTVELIK